MKKAIQFGAGNIGRGFIGSLLSFSGYDVVFADVNKDIINKINEDKRYLLEVVGEEVQNIYVQNVSAISSLENSLLEKMQKASIITTAVGPNILDKIAPTIASFIKEKYNKNNKEYVNIIACENMVGASEYLKEKVIQNLNNDEIKFLEDYIGFVNCAVDRIVPPTSKAKHSITDVTVEQFKEWIVDKTQFKGDIPKIEGMELTDNLMAYVERKIFTLNTGHAITAYLGYLKGYNTIRESILDKEIEEVVKGAMKESGEVLIKKYGFDKEMHYKYIEKILTRFKNPYLKDDVIRVGRQPLRKLSKSDRLVKPFMGTIEFKTSGTNLIKGIAAALCYDLKEDEQAVEVQKIIKENTLEQAIEKITGLKEESKEVKSIAEQVKEIKK